MRILYFLLCMIMFAIPLFIVFYKGKIPKLSSRVNRNWFSMKGGMWLTGLVTYAIILFLGYIILTDEVWRAWLFPLSFFIWTNVVLIICINLWMRDSKFKNSAAIIGCLVVVIIYFHVKDVSKHTERTTTEVIQQNQNYIPSTTNVDSINRKFPDHGEKIQIQKGRPIKAFLIPGKTWTVCYLPQHRNYTAGAVYVSALDTNIVFYDTIPSRCQEWGNPRRREWKEHYREWLEFPPGPCFVYVLGRPSMLFTWHTNK